MKEKRFYAEEIVGVQGCEAVGCWETAGHVLWVEA